MHPKKSHEISWKVSNPYEISIQIPKETHKIPTVDLRAPDSAAGWILPESLS